MSEREKLIIDFYEDGKPSIIIKIILKLIKEKKNGNRSINTMDRTRNNSISNNGNYIIRTNEMY